MPATKTARPPKSRAPSTKPKRTTAELEIDGRPVPVSNLEKVLYPEVGFTKADVINYYIQIAPHLLPHLKDRPITLKRYPNGVTSPFFYEKRCPMHRPDWVSTIAVWSEQNNENINFCAINDLPTLVWAANLADLELHTYLAKAQDVDRPTMLVFDMDPGPPANVIECAQVAILMRQLLETLKLDAYIKTSGSKGLQVYVPLNTPANYDQTKLFAKTMAQLLEQRNPQLITSNMSKALRKGKVFIDWSQNDSHKTTVCVYSLRAKERPTVSTPLQWTELSDALKKRAAEKLMFDWKDILKRVDKMGDLFAPVLKLKQKLPGPEKLEAAASSIPAK